MTHLPIYTYPPFPFTRTKKYILNKTNAPFFLFFFLFFIFFSFFFPSFFFFPRPSYFTQRIYIHTPISYRDKKIKNINIKKIKKGDASYFIYLYNAPTPTPTP